MENPCNPYLQFMIHSCKATGRLTEAAGRFVSCFIHSVFCRTALRKGQPGIPGCNECGLQLTFEQPVQFLRKIDHAGFF